MTRNSFESYPNNENKLFSWVLSWVFSWLVKWSWKIFPASFHECLLRKKVCFRYLGMTRKSFWSFLSHINNTGILSLWNALLHQWESEIGHFDGLDVDHVAKFVWKNFPERPLSHYPISRIVFSLVGSHEIQLEKFSRNAPHSWPEIRNFEKSLEKFSKKPSEWPPGFWKYFPGFGNMG